MDIHIWPVRKSEISSSLVSFGYWGDRKHIPGLGTQMVAGPDSVEDSMVALLDQDAVVCG